MSKLILWLLGFLRTLPAQELIKRAWDRRQISLDAPLSDSDFERMAYGRELDAEPIAVSDGVPVVWVTLLGRGYWQLQREVVWRFTDDRLMLDLAIRIPAGYQFDLASVPRWAWRIIAPFELGIVAPLVHDRLYELEGRLAGQAPVNRKEADQIFRAIMRLENVPKWRRQAAYLALRIGGRRW